MASPKLQGILETALYVKDLPVSRDFFTRVFGLKVLLDEERICALAIDAEHVLLLFLEGASTQGVEAPGGFIPAHDGSGQLHMALRVSEAEIPAWRDHLVQSGVPIVSEVTTNGGLSLYFHDPDGHVLELASSQIWRSVS